MIKKLLLSTLLIVAATGISFSQEVYEKSVEVVASLGVGEYSNSTFGAYMVNGYRFNSYIMAGVGFGIGYSSNLTGVDIKNGITTEHRMDAWPIPIFGVLKANLSQGKLAPFVRLNIGYTFDINQYIKDAPGVMIEPAIGLDVKIDVNKTFYTMLGVNLQNCKYTYAKNIGEVKNWELSTETEFLKAVSIRCGIAF